jgi:hypothetical protein
MKGVYLYEYLEKIGLAIILHLVVHSRQVKKEGWNGL